MMLLMARAATSRLSIGSTGLYGWCRFSDQATSAPWAGAIGSSPTRPVLLSVNCGLPELASSANTHRICWVPLAQAKLTWPGSESTSGFPHAVVISACMVATLDGHDAPPVTMTITRLMTRATADAAAPYSTGRLRKKAGW